MKPILNSGGKKSFNKLTSSNNSFLKFNLSIIQKIPRMNKRDDNEDSDFSSNIFTPPLSSSYPNYQKNDTFNNVNEVEVDEYEMNEIVKRGAVLPPLSPPIFSSLSSSIISKTF
jgi:hypothetical protein